MKKWLLAVLIVSASAQAAEHGVKELSPGRLLLKEGEMAVGISPAPAKIERVLIIIHGRLRNAQTYLRSAEQAAELAGQSQTTLVIAPQFLNEDDVAIHPVADTVLRWQGNDWMAGGESTAPFHLSAYQALDEIIARLGDRQQFPDVKQIVIAGHSGGAQVVQRYAMLGHDQPALQAAGVPVRYVIANPSSYAYFDERRPVAFSHATCPNFNRWKYGLTDLPAYAEGQTPAQLQENYLKRDIVYLLGQQDIDPNHPALDKSCEAEAQGPYRLARGHNYFDYLKRLAPAGLSQQLVEVPGVGHNGDGMLTSPEGQKALFGP
ncbi:alpha/beta fold hydrolase [Pseudomonas vancouverensis]|uniref:Alpha/beta hydrolase n=1 Tax=Pseudomonas vancouverensis TaxID=95300 RepID=A0A1H2PHK3_PSEVA|nr:alpha/beta fold hydrolase [Pseudomonas vancouverensis]KAB0492634.1 alpha/beta fold hydrolase [Pseudomonas vancouverensis]TDB58416.1 alpha/beta hydrolase [Pseudomonas vancouverensis]SDV17163.1 Alpha/beta hydrolase family protein [Pseudomonas vancouverensis]